MSLPCLASAGYVASSLAKRMHDFPHRNRNFKEVSNVFAPTDTEYLEGVGFSAGVFFIVGLIVFFFVIVYLISCCLCCKSSGDGISKRAGCHWAFLVVCCVLCGVGLILGYYGNEDVKKGVHRGADAIISGNGTVSSATTKVATITRELNVSEDSLKRLNVIWATNISDPAYRQTLIDETDNSIDAVRDARTQTVDIERQLKDVADLSKYADDMKKYDDWRWKGTIGALCYIILIMLLVVLALICNSPGLLKLVAFLSIIGLLVMWLASGVFVSVAVLGGDFCVDPNGYVERTTRNKTFQDTVRYFVYCGNCTNPFRNDYMTAINQIQDARRRALNLTDAAASQDLQAAVDETRMLNFSLLRSETSLQSLWMNEVNCSTINKDYNNLLSAACNTTLDGAVFTFAGALILGFALCFVVMSGQGYWRRLEVEDSGWEDDSRSRRRRFRGRESYKMKRRY